MDQAHLPQGLGARAVAVLATALGAAVLAAASIAPAQTLSAAERRSALERVCAAFGEDVPTSLERDALGDFCSSPGRAPEDGPSPFLPDLSELRWAAALPGRFQPGGEWLVSLRGRCVRHCPGVTFVVRREGGEWQVLSTHEQLVSEDCIVVTGFEDGLDRLICPDSAGPYQGGISVWLELVSFGEGEPARRLLGKDQGGECNLADPPESAEYDGDRLVALTPSTAADETAFTVRLEVRRRQCDRTTEFPELDLEPAAVHELRFLKRGQDVVPDAESAALLRRYGWL